jgi:hypothetical protein
MLWTRRVHLCFGLALLPWVMLYGITAILFNHAALWSATSEFRWVRPAEQRPGLRALADADSQARAALAALRVQGGAAAGSLELRPASARWVGGLQVVGSARNDAGDAREVRITLDPQGRTALLRQSPGETEEGPAWNTGASPLDVAALDQPRREALLTATAELLRERGLEPSGLGVRRAPDLEFMLIDADGSAWACRLGPEGRLETAAGAPAPDWRERLLHLHVQHGDPGYAAARRIWFALVDVVGLAMLLWGATGIAMWWTIRPARRLGTAALACGALAMGVLAVSVWAELGV